MLECPVASGVGAIVLGVIAGACMLSAIVLGAYSAFRFRDLEVGFVRDFMVGKEKEYEMGQLEKKWRVGIAMTVCMLGAIGFAFLGLTLSKYDYDGVEKWLEDNQLVASEDTPAHFYYQLESQISRGCDSGQVQFIGARHSVSNEKKSVKVTPSENVCRVEIVENAGSGGN